MPTLNIETAKLNYEEKNPEKSEAILFIHGNSSSNKEFTNQLNHVGFAKFRLIAVDLPGHGKSSPGSPLADGSHYSISYFAEALKTFLSKLNVSNPILVGHSLGGHIAIELSKRIKIKGLVTHQSPYIEHISDMERAFPQIQELSNFFTEELSDDQVLQTVRVLEFQKPLPAFVSEDIRNTDGKFRAKLIQSIMGTPEVGEVKQINDLKCAILNIVSPQDKLTVMNYISGLNLPSNVSTVLVENSGHFPHLDEPVKFNQALENFLNKLA